MAFVMESAVEGEYFLSQSQPAMLSDMVLTSHMCTGLPTVRFALQHFLVRMLGELVCFVALLELLL